MMRVNKLKQEKEILSKKLSMFKSMDIKDLNSQKNKDI